MPKTSSSAARPPSAATILALQVLARLQVAVLVRRGGDEAERLAAGDDAEDLRRVAADQVPAEGVAGLVVGDDAALAGVHHPRLLGADRLAQQRLVEVLAGHRVAAGAAGDDRPLVEGVGELGAGHPGRLAGDVAQVEVGAERLALGVGAEDRLAAVAVGRGDEDLAVEAPGPQQRVVELVDVVGGGDHDHRAGVALEAVELDQELVERLLALAGAAVAAAAEREPPIASSSSMKITARPALRASLKRRRMRAAPRPTNISTKLEPEAEKKSTPGLGGDGAGQHRLAGPGRPVEQDAARGLGAERREALRFLQPGGDVDQLVLGGVDPLHLLPEHRLGLARLDRFRLGFAHRAAQQREEDQHQGEHEEDPEDRVPVEEEAL